MGGKSRIEDEERLRVKRGTTHESHGEEDGGDEEKRRRKAREKVEK